MKHLLATTQYWPRHSIGHDIVSDTTLNSIGHNIIEHEESVGGPEQWVKSRLGRKKNANPIVNTSRRTGQAIAHLPTQIERGRAATIQVQSIRSP
jgi:hypothetical protein